VNATAKRVLVAAVIVGVLIALAAVMLISEFR
jgi:hypothetical protein